LLLKGEAIGTFSFIPYDPHKPGSLEHIKSFKTFSEVKEHWWVLIQFNFMQKER
jgi:hypothetical protein